MDNKSYSKGICWIDDCRIPFVDEKINFDRPRIREKNQEWILTGGFTFENPDVKEYNSQGRFPANILVSDDMLNDGVIQVSKKGNIRDSINKGVFGGGIKNPNNEYTDKGSSSRYYDIDKWFEKLLDV